MQLIVDVDQMILFLRITQLNETYTLGNATMSSHGSLYLDAKNGFGMVDLHGSMNSRVLPEMKFSVCQENKIPKQVLQPLQQIDEVRAALLLNTRSHEVSHDLATYTVPGSPDVVTVLATDATPVEFGIGDSYIQYTNWRQGVGSSKPSCPRSWRRRLGVSKPSCSRRLLEDTNEPRPLWVFDQIMYLIMGQEPLRSVLGFVPALPSDLFSTYVEDV